MKILEGVYPPSDEKIVKLRECDPLRVSAPLNALCGEIGFWRRFKFAELLANGLCGRENYDRNGRLGGTMSSREEPNVKCRTAILAFVLVAGLSSSLRASDPAPETLAQLQKAFSDYSAARLVFTVKELPEGSYHDVMPPLDEKARLQAARIALREARKLPPRYLGRMGLKAVGIFAACISNQGDGFRPYDEELKGYRFFGIYNGKNALAAAYYSDEQLPATLHHEIFHHVDATRRGETRYTVRFVRDPRFQAALSGEEPYPPLRIGEADLAALKKRGVGRVLERAVSKYADKSVGEDKAETARYLMTALPDALVQMATRAELAGSQRLLHVLHRYGEAVPDGPSIDWFVSLALNRK